MILFSCLYTYLELHVLSIAKLGIVNYWNGVQYFIFVYNNILQTVGLW